MTNNDIQNAYMGVSAVTKICLGEDVVWPTTPPVPVYSAMPLTFKILSGGTIEWKANNPNNTKTIQYSLNGGEWTNITSTTAGTSFNVSEGDVVEFKGDNSSYSQGSIAYYNCFATSVVYNVYGNIMSLIDSTGFASLTNFTADRPFANLFKNNTGLIDAGNLVLPATTGAENGYYGMFEGCTSLATAPELPATTLEQSFYERMFLGCICLTQAPELPATTLFQNCYREMFSNCSNLSSITCLATNISARYSTYNWLNNVAATGTFVKHPNMTSWTRDENGIPAGWTVIDADI